MRIDRNLQVSSIFSLGNIEINDDRIQVVGSTLNAFESLLSSLFSVPLGVEPGEPMPLVHPVNRWEI